MIWVKAGAPFALLEAVAAALPTPRDGTWTDAHEDRPTEPLALDLSVLSRLLRRFMHYDYVDGRLLAAVLAALAHGGERGEANTESGGLENMSNTSDVPLFCCFLLEVFVEMCLPFVCFYIATCSFPTASC